MPTPPSTYISEYDHPSPFIEVMIYVKCTRKKIGATGEIGEKYNGPLLMLPLSLSLVASVAPERDILRHLHLSWYFDSLFL